VKLVNGTEIIVGPDWCLTRLPCGREVHAHPNAESPAMAERLGYGQDVAAMTRHHDALHSMLCCMLGMTASHSLMLVAGCESDATLAALEEDAVLAVQRFARAAGWEGVW
jgi:hypothetical protein